MSENPYRGVCVWCGRQVWEEHCARQVLAWEVERKGGGANQVSGPGKLSTGKVMHVVCHGEAVRSEATGINRDQMTLA